MNKKITKTGALALALLIGVGGTGIAYFTDYASTNFTGKAGTIGINNDIKANQDQLDILNPGDITPLEFDVKNTGNKLMRVKENISLSFWIPVRQLKEGVNINGRELRYDDFDLSEEKILKDKDGNYVKAVPFEIKEENGELPFYITDEEGNKITDYEITSDERTEKALQENEIPSNDATKQRYGIKDNKNELIPRKNKIKFNIPHYFILDGNKDLSPRETAENRQVKDIHAVNDDNVVKKYNLVFNKEAGNKYQDIIVEVKHDTEGRQWLNQYEDYTEKDFLKDDTQRLINQVTDKTKKKEFTERNNNLKTEEDLNNFKKEIEDYLETEKLREEINTLINKVKNKTKRDEFIGENNNLETVNELKKLKSDILTYLEVEGDSSSENIDKDLIDMIDKVQSKTYRNIFNNIYNNKSYTDKNIFKEEIQTRINFENSEEYKNVKDKIDKIEDNVVRDGFKDTLDNIDNEEQLNKFEEELDKYLIEKPHYFLLINDGFGYKSKDDVKFEFEGKIEYLNMEAEYMRDPSAKEYLDEEFNKIKEEYNKYLKEYNDLYEKTLLKVNSIKNESKRNELKENLKHGISTYEEIEKIRQTAVDVGCIPLINKDGKLIEWSEELFEWNGNTVVGLKECGEALLRTNNGHMVIPERATAIGNYAFAKRTFEKSYKEALNKKITNISITKIDIPNTVTSIGEGAFVFNDLQELYLPDSVKTIGTAAFSENNISKLRLSENLTKLGEEKIIMNSGWQGVFSGNKLTEVTIPESLTVIANFSFYNNNIQKINFSSNTEIIGRYAFQNNKLTSLDLSNLPNLTTIGNYAFSYNQLTSLNLSNLPNLTKIEKYSFNKNQIKDFTVSNISQDIEVISGAFKGNPYPENHYVNIIRNNPQN